MYIYTHICSIYIGNSICNYYHYSDSDIYRGNSPITDP